MMSGAPAKKPPPGSVDWTAGAPCVCTKYTDGATAEDAATTGLTFNQPLVWDTREVTDMGYLFNGVTTFDQALKWDTEKVTEFKQFRRCEKLIPKNEKCVD